LEKSRWQIEWQACRHGRAGIMGAMPWRKESS